MNFKSPASMSRGAFVAIWEWLRVILGYPGGLGIKALNLVFRSVSGIGVLSLAMLGCSRGVGAVRACDAGVVAGWIECGARGSGLASCRLKGRRDGTVVVEENI